MGKERRGASPGQMLWWVIALGCDTALRNSGHWECGSGSKETTEEVSKKSEVRWREVRDTEDGPASMYGDCQRRCKTGREKAQRAEHMLGIWEPWV